MKLSVSPHTLAQWQPLIEAMVHAVWLVEAQDLRIVAVNREAGALMGQQPSELLGREVLDFAATPEDLCFWNDVSAGLANGIDSETFVTRRDGVVVPVARRVSWLDAGNAGSEGGAFVVALHDRSAQVRVERQLEGAVAELRATFESTHDGILVTDLAGHIRNFNQRFAQLWSVPAGLLDQRNDDGVLEWMRRAVTEPSAYMRRLATIDDGPSQPCADTLELTNGTVLERLCVPQCTHGQPTGRVFSFRDITEQVEAKRRIEALSYTDSLTGLPNRRLLADRLDVALAQAQRNGTRLALLFLNLDHFKNINETLGRAFGDRVLIDVAGRIKGCLRQGDTVARLGGDEFVILAHQAAETGAERAACRVQDALGKPFSQAGMSFTVTASVGIALYPNDGATMDDMLRHCEAAMREAKQAGRAAFRFHRARPAQEEVRSRSRMQLDHAMRQALAQGRFRLHYQPQIDIHSGAIVGAEALLRWRDPDLGEVSPGEFIPVAEETGFIVPIGDWVLHDAVRQAAAWVAAGAGCSVAINVSALQFQQPGFVESVANVLREFNLSPEWIELELTESCLIQDAPDAMQRLQALAQLGVRLAIDDFGLGYSSLAYLKRFPISRLKIDRSFVSGLPTGESDAGIVRAIINMGRALRLKVVAEGVETEAQRQFLEQSGCDLYQGFLFAPALEVAAFEAKLGLDPRARLALAR